MLLNVLVQKYTGTVLCETVRYNVRFVVSDGSGFTLAAALITTAAAIWWRKKKKVSIILTPPPSAIPYVPSWQW
jgi:hypothetical protein